MTLTRIRAKARRESGSFAALPHEILDSPEWAKLSVHAVRALLDLFAQYRGENNGDFSATWSRMQKRGWRSKDTLYRALRELQTKGWIVKTRQGGIHRCNLYAVTWRPIDHCNGKIDVTASRVALGTWKNKSSSPVVVPICPGSRTYSRGAP